MNYKKLMTGIISVLTAFSLYSCGDSKESSSEAESSSQAETQVAETTEAETEPEETTEPTTVEEKIPPTPVEASDENAVTFDDGEFSFVTVISDDDEAAKGELSVVEVEGNKMLKFTDDFSVPLDGKVQKLSVNATQLIGTENLGKVRSIAFDMYADAVEADYENMDGEFVQVPGTISGGGGTVTAKDDKWYDFSGFEGGEYDFEMSGAVHAEFKFLLADSGLCWSEDMEDANFLIMRWGSESSSNLYIDNIIFYDESGNSIPLS